MALTKYCIVVAVESYNGNYFRNYFDYAESIGEDIIKAWQEKYDGKIINIIKTDEKIC